MATESTSAAGRLTRERERREGETPRHGGKICLQRSGPTWYAHRACICVRRVPQVSARRVAAEARGSALRCVVVRVVVMAPVPPSADEKTAEEWLAGLGVPERVTRFLLVGFKGDVWSLDDIPTKDDVFRKASLWEDIYRDSVTSGPYPSDI